MPRATAAPFSLRTRTSLSTPIRFASSKSRRAVRRAGPNTSSSSPAIPSQVKATVTLLA